MASIKGIEHIDGEGIDALNKKVDSLQTELNALRVLHSSMKDQEDAYLRIVEQSLRSMELCCIALERALTMREGEGK